MQVILKKTIKALFLILLVSLFTACGKKKGSTPVTPNSPGGGGGSQQDKPKEDENTAGTVYGADEVNAQLLMVADKAVAVANAKIQFNVSNVSENAVVAATDEEVVEAQMALENLLGQMKVVADKFKNDFHVKINGDDFVKKLSEEQKGKIIELTQLIFGVQEKINNGEVGADPLPSASTPEQVRQVLSDLFNVGKLAGGGEESEAPSASTSSALAAAVPQLNEADLGCGEATSLVGEPGAFCNDPIIVGGK